MAEVYRAPSLSPTQSKTDGGVIAGATAAVMPRGVGGALHHRDRELHDLAGSSTISCWRGERGGRLLEEIVLTA